MFKDNADVDYYPPETEPLSPSSNNDINNSESGLVSMEEQRRANEERGGATASISPSSDNNDNDNTDNSPGLTDGYEQWSQTFDAFHSAIYHTIVYFVIGTVGYSYLLDTKWAIIDSLYFSVVLYTTGTKTRSCRVALCHSNLTIVCSVLSSNASTVGYGDLCPSTKQGEIFTIFFSLYGIIILGIFLGVVGDMVVESRRTKRKDALENARRKYLNTFQHGTYQSGKHPPLQTTPEDSATTISDSSYTSGLQDSFHTYFGILKEQFWAIVSLVIIAIPIIYIERWDAVKGIYWMVITGTTVGLGDETPTQPISKALCILYIPVAVYSVGRTLGLFASTYQDARDRQTEERFFSRALTLSDIERMDFDRDGRVSREEFLIYMLTTLQKVEEDDINDILNLFSKLDKTRDGSLDSDDLMASVQLTNQLTISSRPDSRLSHIS